LPRPSDASDAWRRPGVWLCRRPGRPGATGSSKLRATRYGRAKTASASRDAAEWNHFVDLLPAQGILDRVDRARVADLAIGVGTGLASALRSLGAGPACPTAPRRKSFGLMKQPPGG